MTWLFRSQSWLIKTLLQNYAGTPSAPTLWLYKFLLIGKILYLRCLLRVFGKTWVRSYLNNGKNFENQTRKIDWQACGEGCFGKVVERARLSPQERATGSRLQMRLHSLFEFSTGLGKSFPQMLWLSYRSLHGWQNWLWFCLAASLLVSGHRRLLWGYTTLF